MALINGKYSHYKDACCGYEVPGSFLLRYLKGAMRLDRCKSLPVHVLLAPVTIYTH